MNTQATASSSSPPSAARAPAPTINVRLFWQRARQLFDHWTAAQGGGRGWGLTLPSSPFGSVLSPAAAQSSDPTAAKADAIAIVTAAGESGEAYSRLLAVTLWLYQYEIPDAITLFTVKPQTITIVTSAKKIRFLTPLNTASATDTSGIQLKLIETAKDTDTRTLLTAECISLIRSSNNGKRVGYVGNKTVEQLIAKNGGGGLLAPFIRAANDASLSSVDVSIGVGLLLQIADSEARKALQVAGDVSTRVMKKFLIPEIESIIDEERTAKQSALADLAEDQMRDATKLGLSNIRNDDVDSCYSPIIQSGGDIPYDLKPSAASSDTPLLYDSGTAIIVQLGARYKNYCTNIGRTYLINPSDHQRKIYLLLTQVYIAAKQAIRNENQANAVMLNALRVIEQSDMKELKEKFTKTCGFGMGLEFRDALLLLNEKNTRALRKGMCLNLCIGFSDLIDTVTGKKYALLIADTILVQEEDNESLTKMPRDYKDITYLIGDAADNAAADTPTNGADIDILTARTRGTGRRTGAADSSSDVAGEEAEKARRAHQAELAKRQREDALKRLAADTVDEHFNLAANGSDQTQFTSYTAPSAYPAHAKKDRITVDVQAESILLPIHDQIVPFHINTIKNVHKHTEGQVNFLRITFNVPDQKQMLAAANAAAIAAANGASTTSSSTSASTTPPLQYVSELNYRSESDSLDKVYFDIKELRKRIQNRTKEQEAKSSLVTQEELILERKNTVPTLKDISARPQLNRRKQTGTLQAHVNGLRYVSNDKMKVDIIYANLKSCFYQPAEETHQVLLHFELKNALLIDKTKTKKTNFFQVYFEVIEVSEDLNMANRYRDEDGIMEEQQERVKRKRWNERFLQFVREVEEKMTSPQSSSHGAVNIEFDIPYRELAFTGVPAKQTVTIMPTVHSLVALDDTPPMVLPLNEVEIAVFERIQFSLRNFDLVFVWKDFTKLPLRVDSIPTTFLEQIKSWLNSCDIVFFESPSNLLWKPVMQTILKDIDDFWKQGGWAAILTDDGNDGDGDGNDSDGNAVDEESEFEPSSDESEGESSEEYDTASSENSDDSDSDASEATSESEGDDWEALDRKAVESDRARAVKARLNGGEDMDDSDDDGAAKRRKPAAPARGGGGGGGGGGARPAAGKSGQSGARPPAGRPGASSARPTSAARPGAPARPTGARPTGSSSSQQKRAPPPQPASKKVRS